ncbi:ATP-binding protein [Variovorax sp. J2P1-59]|uniref:PAS domain-containing hybrid sensor histidine kinase/response regulator n=1 Tax=Variovorax flavidus TaxID=3053501 RepID=UPI002574DE59|nr:ATP-binding protein [Variovorax sp. J2P1-59]MDM0074994.1 ATP-binding protein [Variovorax sp. J2P1-59]
MTPKVRRIIRTLDGGVGTMALTCLLGVASYFVGQPSAIELSWFWVALGSLCIVSLAVLQYARARRVQRRDDELQAIVDAVPHVVFFKDTNFRYQTLNAEFEKVFDLDVHSVLGKTDKEVFDPEIHARLASQDREILGSGVAHTYEQQAVFGGDGSLRTIQTRKRPVHDRRGKLLGIVGVAIDVTEQRLVQRQLEDANTRLGIALDAARMGFWEWNLATGEIRADPRAREILGFDDTIHDATAAFANLHPDDIGGIMARIEVVRTRKEIAAYEFRVIHPSGEERWVEGFSSVDRAREGSDYLIGVNRDITERRRSELELSEAKQRADRALAELELSRNNLALALSIGGLGVWRSVTLLPRRARLADSAFLDTVLTTDSKVREFLGLGEDSAVTYRDLLSMLHPEDRDRVAARLELTYRRRHSAYRDHFRVCSRDGVVRTLDTQGSMTRHVDSHGDTVAVSFTGIAKDITKEEELKADLVAKAEEARSAVEAKAHFLAMMSHEVRTPLNGVLGMIDLVIDTPLTDDQRSMLQRSRESSVALLTIINDILDFSKIEARMLDLERRPLSLGGLIEDVCATMAPETSRKGIRLDFQVDPQIPPFIVGDSVRLRQVLTNLIGNAVKFTHQGGVKVEARRISDRQFELAVEDTGIGIDPRVTKSLFQPFRQADVATTRRYGGTGLGLTIVKQLVDLMQGRIDCHSQLNRGSRFAVTLPLHAWTPGAGSAHGHLAAQPAASSRVKPAAGDALAMTRTPAQKVLLAEDHPINREVITRQLAKLGYECDCAEDGEQAWERLSAPGASYSMLLTDCHMPRLDGYELTQRLRDREARLGLPRLPIVALTANALRGEAERCIALGMDAYLSKPLQLADLRKTLLDVMPEPPAPDSAGAAPGTAGSSKAEPKPPYEALADLCGGDLGKVAKLVDIFVAATSEDVKAMDRAFEAGDHAALRQLAHRLSSACHQLGETGTVTRLRAIEHLEDADNARLQDKLGELYGSARKDLSAVLGRASDFTRTHA